ncbi:sigma-70 family RNA polymerase sigma factor [Pararhodobacter sp. CCB-MM2]|uniref:sigma-70 family RNA polymerase sigma factor n=1 Tax=Pararhodobacter sp. CCB-MM2 TaxID=1786003 RepID=UPI001F420C04|nr:sigma-70 family RNA polymerase sigma factor [Pararhodobacter sp. CCB-MM2]
MILEGTVDDLAHFAASHRVHATDAKGDTPLHIAACIGNLVLCDLFVRSGSDPRALNNEQQTPADIALAEGHSLAAQLLYSLIGEPLPPEQLESVQENPKDGITAALLEGDSRATSPSPDGSVRDEAVQRARDGLASSSWSEERVQRLMALWTEGQSANQIARELGGVSRNAVLSKLFRLGILNESRPDVDSPEGQQIPVDSDAPSNPPEEPSKVRLRLFTPAGEQRPQNADAKTLRQWHAGTFWTAARIDVLKRMWLDGKSAREIARSFGGVLTPGAVLFELHRLGIHDRARGQTDPLTNEFPDFSSKAEPSHPVEFTRDSVTSGSPVQHAELEDLLSFEAEEEPEKFFDKTENQTASGAFVAVLNSSPAVLDDEAADWELDLSPVPIAGEGIGSSAAAQTDQGGESDFLQVRNRGRKSVKRVVVQSGTRMSIDSDLCLTWAEEILAKGHCSLDDIDRLVALSEGNGDLEELRANLQRNLEAAGFDISQATGHDTELWDAVSDTSSHDLADAMKAALTRRTRLPGTQRFVMEKSEELQLLEPMMRAKQELQLGILGSETAVQTILDVMDSIRDGARDPNSVSLRTIIPSRPDHAETSEVMAAVEALRSWQTTGRVMDGKRRREALAALEALDLSLAFQKELVRRMEQFPACQAWASQLEAEILISESATEHLIREHLPYVRRFASRNVDEGEDPEDVFQVAFMGLQRSTRRFDPERGYRFLIYATYWMRQAVMRWRADEGTAIRIPVHRNEKITKLDRALEKLDVRVSGAISDLELAEELEWTIDEVRQFRDIPREAEYPVSLDEWDNLLPEPSEVDVFDEAETERIVTEALADLPERQADVIRMRFGIGRETDMTLEEIGQIYGVTRERIRQIEAKGLDRLAHPGRKRRLQELLGYDSSRGSKSYSSTAQEQHSPAEPKEKRQSPASWSESRVGRLRELWAAGLSASEIAQELGGTSRNAVIGKLSRLGLADSDREQSQ